MCGKPHIWKDLGSSSRSASQALNIVNCMPWQDTIRYEHLEWMKLEATHPKQGIAGEGTHHGTALQRFGYPPGRSLLSLSRRKISGTRKDGRKQ